MPTGRNRAWADLLFGPSALVVGTDIIVDLLANAPTVDTLTAVRIVGELNAHYDVTNTIVDSDSVVDLGIGVTSMQAFAAGANSVPDPSTMTDYPPRGWLYVTRKYVGQSLTDTTGVTSVQAVFSFDVRAMRKIDKGILYLRMANVMINVGGAMEVSGRVRVLCLT